MSVLIQGGRVVTASDEQVADVLIEDGTIVAIGRNLEAPVETVIDARGQYVLPGCIDPHTHMDMPFGPTFTCDDFTSGTVAAAFGGTTCHVDFAIQERGRSPLTALEAWHAKVERAAPVIDVGFHVAVTDLSDPSWIADLRRLPDEGVTSFKLFMAYKGSFMVDDGTLFQTLEVAAESGCLVMVHAENGDVVDALIRRALARGETSPHYHATTRPPAVEAEATARAIELAGIAQAPLYVVHVSCGAALEPLERARDRGQQVWAETCTHYLHTDISGLDAPGFEGAKHVFSPPPREREEHARLWQALGNGVLSVVSSDHAPFRYADQKALGRDDFSQIPNGAPGVEERLAAVHQLGVRGGHISLTRMVDLLATQPARLFGLYPRKGTIAVGADADVVIFDPELRATLSAQWLHSRVDYTLYEGLEVQGLPRTVLVRGKPIVVDRELRGVPGDGRFVARGVPEPR